MDSFLDDSFNEDEVSDFVPDEAPVWLPFISQNYRQLTNYQSLEIKGQGKTSCDQSQEINTNNPQNKTCRKGHEEKGKGRLRKRSFGAR
jgi:hypothetical protein